MTETTTRTTEPQFPIFRSCPYTPPDEYAGMRESGRPAPGRLYDGSRVWVITKYADARFVLTDPRFSSDITNPGYPVFAEAYEGARGFPTLVTMDPPRHTELRRMLVSEFSAKRANLLRPEIQKTADDLIDAMVAKQGSGPVDLVESFSKPFSGTIICRPLGMSYVEMGAWLARNQTMREKSISLTDSGEVAAEVGNEIMFLQQYFLSEIDNKEREPTGDLVSNIVAKHVAAGNLSKVELANICFLIFMAGRMPMESMITLGVSILVSRPEQLKQLRSGPEAVPGAVDELLRYVSPLDVIPRVAAQDVEVGGQLIRKGESVVVANGGANHDAAEYPDPEQVDVRRSARRHLALGAGEHMCLGTNITRVGLEIAYETLFRRLPDLRPVIEVDDLVPERNQWHPEIARMPVVW